jgi:hypothetical protein
MHTKPALTLFTATILTATILLTGCRSAPLPAPSHAETTDSCQVLTPAEISTTLGIPIDPGHHVLASSSIMCSWPQTGATGEAAQKVVLNFTSLPSFQREKAATAVVITPATGIGDDAFYVTSSLGTSLYIKKGNTAIAFSIHEKLPPATLMSEEKTLGLEATPRL